jgi:hypothetical protein
VEDVPNVFPRLKRYLNVLGYSARVGKLSGAGCVESGPFNELLVTSFDGSFVSVLEVEA